LGAQTIATAMVNVQVNQKVANAILVLVELLVKSKPAQWVQFNRINYYCQFKKAHPPLVPLLVVMLATMLLMLLVLLVPLVEQVKEPQEVLPLHSPPFYNKKKPRPPSVPSMVCVHLALVGYVSVARDITVKIVLVRMIVTMVAPVTVVSACVRMDGED